MKRAMSVLLLVAVAALAIVSFGGVALAEEVKMVGTVSKIEVAADGKSASVTMKDNKTGNPVTLLVTDDLTLEKLKDRRIVVGDEIRVKYEPAGGKNAVKYFRKTAGC